MRSSDAAAPQSSLDPVAWLLRMLWACRVSIISGFGGVALFYFALPAQNLFADLSFDGSWLEAIGFWGAVFLTVVASWALPIHYGARRTLDEGSWMFSRVQRNTMTAAELETIRRGLRSSYQLLICGLPRVLGCVPFVAVAVGIYFGTQTFGGTSGLDEGSMTAFQGKCLLVASLVAAVGYFGLTILRRRWLDRTRLTESRLAAIRWTFTIGMTVLFLSTAYFIPILFSTFWPRALLVPALFGALVLPLSELQLLGHRTGVPILALCAGAMLLATAGNTSFHQLRTLPRLDPGDARLSVDDAVRQWKSANGCLEGKCPRPLIVAIDGGASRAAFMGATIVGELLDRMSMARNEAATPGRRIFAISGVSGGAFGAATIQAALTDAQSRGSDGQPPCQAADRSWFGYAYRPREEGGFRWRECMQALTAGDYLSVTITGLAFRDFAAPVPHLIDDRAALLEQAFERHYDLTVSPRGSPFLSIFRPGRVCKPDMHDGLCRRAARPKDFYALHSAGWIPLLMLNGTSVRTGRRIIVSDVKANDRDILFPEAFDLSEMLSSPCHVSDAKRLNPEIAYPSEVLAKTAADGQTAYTRVYGVCGAPFVGDGDEVRLSTAALVSARFPLISPDGAFRMKSAPEHGDEVVDGGYFENSGLTSALDLTDALVKAGLQPVLLSIGNDPDLDAEDTKIVSRSSMGPLVLTSNYDFKARLLGVFQAPFATLVATREGHAAEAERRVETFDKHSLSFYRMRVAQTPDLAEDTNATAYDKDRCQAIWRGEKRTPLSMGRVSMSWWLSGLVQANLDAQKCSAPNRHIMAYVLKDLGIDPDSH